MRALCGVVGLSTLMLAAPALAVKWAPVKSAENKIQVCLNTGMKFKTSRQGRWTMLVAQDGDVRIVLMTFKGVATFPDMQKTAVVVSKIPAQYWKTTRQSAAWNGFGQNATYVAQGTDRALIAFLAKHGKYIDRNYIVFVNTSKANFLAKQKLFEAWGNCLAAIP
jgi:hypothetical protein